MIDLAVNVVLVAVLVSALLAWILIVTRPED